MFLVKFPDKDESRTHKSWVWDEEHDIYVVGNDEKMYFNLYGIWKKSM